jgi:hypothetical protein
MPSNSANCVRASSTWQAATTTTVRFGGTRPYKRSTVACTNVRGWPKLKNCLGKWLPYKRRVVSASREPSPPASTMAHNRRSFTLAPRAASTTTVHYWIAHAACPKSDRVHVSRRRAPLLAARRRASWARQREPKGASTTRNRVDLLALSAVGWGFASLTGTGTSQGRVYTSGTNKSAVDPVKKLFRRRAATVKTASRGPLPRRPAARVRCVSGLFPARPSVRAPRQVMPRHPDC